MATLTLERPAVLVAQAEQVRDHLAELLALSLGVPPTSEAGGREGAHIIAVLTRQPTPQNILALRPSPELQTRVSDLLARSKVAPLAPDEAAELERALFLDHLVRLAKANALRQLAGAHD